MSQLFLKVEFRFTKVEMYKRWKEDGFFIHDKKKKQQLDAVNYADFYLQQCHPAVVSLPERHIWVVLMSL